MRYFLISLALIAGLISPSAAFAELDELTMYWFKSRVTTCGRAYQVGNVATYAKTRFGLPDFRSLLLRLAESEGASEAQLEELGQDYDDGQNRSIQEGFIEDIELDEFETKIAMILFPIMHSYCYADKIFFFELK